MVMYGTYHPVQTRLLCLPLLGFFVFPPGHGTASFIKARQQPALDVRVRRTETNDVLRFTLVSSFPFPD